METSNCDLRVAETCNDAWEAFVRDRDLYLVAEVVQCVLKKCCAVYNIGP